MATKKGKPAQADRKTDALSIRIDPRLRFGLELMARSQRRSVTGVVEWALDEALERETIKADTGHPVSFRKIVVDLWSPNEVERLVNLGENFPELMTYEESRLWKVIDQTPDFWADRKKLRFTWMVRNQWDKLRPLISEAAERSVVSGLTKKELEDAGVEFF